MVTDKAVYIGKTITPSLSRSLLLTPNVRLNLFCLIAMKNNKRIAYFLCFCPGGHLIHLTHVFEDFCNYGESCCATWGKLSHCESAMKLHIVKY